MIRLPEGMRDRLYDECAARREREAGLFSLFAERGYTEVSTPILEHYGLFTRTGSPISEEMMVKVIGNGGKICVLRPDNTAPIARVAVTRLQNEPLPLKLWYAQPVYRAGGNGCREFLQAGVEVIGEAGDAELLALGHEAASLFFGKPPHIEVSHAGVLRAMFDKMGLDAARTAHAASLIERKNFAALGDEFTGAEPLLKLLRLSGGAEVIGEAESIAGTPEPFRVLRGLLSELPEGAVEIDFSLAPPFGYYTGIFFRGYTEGAADAVLTGGRYDKLLGYLGRDLPAVGFAVHMEGA
ncbi:MAG: ATP phosphoribosyltransferase regulatory subunit [Oscillospiraceae bacterium]|nr:ATP phosphoribosyltransferase regulatory subunit [Oscillospiraceae bacterium]